MARYFANQVMISEMSQMVNEMKDLRAYKLAMNMGGGGGLSIPSLSRGAIIERAKIEAQKNYDEIKAKISEIEFKGDSVPDELKDQLKDFETFEQKFDKLDAQEFEKKFGKTGLNPGKLIDKNKNIIENLAKF